MAIHTVCVHEYVVISIFEAVYNQSLKFQPFSFDISVNSATDSVSQLYGGHSRCSIISIYTFHKIISAW